jgi:predicted metalloprotease with PDZ domain
MMHQRHYMRVYWSGAAIALIADVDLRRRSGGSVSLDTVFEQLSRCCLPSRRRWGARELMAKMDEIAGYRTFVPLYERYAMRPLFPDLEESYRHLGLEVNARALKFSDDVAPRSLRADIMRGR